MACWLTLPSSLPGGRVLSAQSPPCCPCSHPPIVVLLQGAARPLFPFEDAWEHVAHDEYGASLDFADFDPAEATGGWVRCMSAEEGRKGSVCVWGGGGGGGCASLCTVLTLIP